MSKEMIQLSEVVFQGISIDSRQIKPGDLFVAIKGEQFDGHHFVAQAKEKGAIAAVVSEIMPVDLPQIPVPNTRIALGELAAKHRQQFDLPVIALTGSCGKTTTKEMLRAILQQCGEVLAPKSSFNNDIGVPLTLLQLNASHQYAVIEMGANHPGEIAYLTQLAKPNLAFILNVAPAHLAGFGSIEGVMQAKSEIFTGLAADGIAMINNDDRFASQWHELLKNRQNITFGVHNPADYSAMDIQSDAVGRYRFTLLTPHGNVAIQLPLFGEHYILNAVAAAAAAQQVGASLAAIKAGLETMQAVKGRLMLKQGQAGARILDDSYNAIPYAVAASLKVLAQYEGERVFVFGGMAEIGETAEQEHIRMGELAQSLGIQKLYAYGDLSALTVKAFGSGGYHFTEQNELIQSLCSILQADMTLLIKGARSSKMENVVNALTINPF